jgi:hypothetical protein
MFHTNLYYHGVRVLCAALLCFALYEKAQQDFAPMSVFEVSKGDSQVTTIYRNDSQVTVIPKTKENLLYLQPQSLVGCTSSVEATKLAKVFADTGTDPIKSGFAYNTYWDSNSCNIYNNGVTLKPDLVQVSFTTPQKALVKVFLAKEGKVDTTSFWGSMYIVMVSPEILNNIFQCVHDVDPESGFDRIELCRPNI